MGADRNDERSSLRTLTVSWSSDRSRRREINGRESSLIILSRCVVVRANENYGIEERSRNGRGFLCLDTVSFPFPMVIERIMPTFAKDGSMNRRINSRITLKTTRLLPPHRRMIHAPHRAPDNLFKEETTYEIHGLLEGRALGYFVCTHADILPTLSTASAFLQRWSKRRSGLRDQYWRPLDQSRHRPPLFHPLPQPSQRTERREGERERGREREGDGDREREREGETRPTRVRAGPLRITNPQKPSRLRCCLTATAVATTLHEHSLSPFAALKRCIRIIGLLEGAGERSCAKKNKNLEARLFVDKPEFRYTIRK